MLIFIGIDLSINSSGICVSSYDNDLKLIQNKFFIVKPDKLSKKEKVAQEKYADIISYVTYNKTDLAQFKDNNHMSEYHKTLNMLEILHKIYQAISEYIDDIDNTIYVCQEGISYGSTLRTKSVFDLAGLNYLLRSLFIDTEDIHHFIIATPAEIKKFATGKGNANKTMMMNVFNMLFDDLDIPKKDDIADAFFMASYAKHIYETTKGRT